MPWKQNPTRWVTFALTILALALLTVAYLYPPRLAVDQRHEVYAAAESVRLFALGDAGTGGADQIRIAEAMETVCAQGGAGVDAVLYLGDNFYMDGVSSIDDPQWLEKFHKVYDRPCLRRSQFLAVLGNHDYKGEPEAEIRYTIVGASHGRRPAWVMPARNYVKDFGGIARVIGIDTNFADFCLLAKMCTLDFLRTALKPDFAGVAKPAWTFVMGHHPMLSSSTKSAAHRGRWLGPLLRPFVCDSAQFYLSGHAHHMEDRQPEKCGTRLMVSGGGGADRYAITSDEPGVAFAESVHGFIEFVVTSDKVDWTFWDGEPKTVHRGARVADRSSN